jgi:hypothetical protein
MVKVFLKCLYGCMDTSIAAGSNTRREQRGESDKVVQQLDVNMSHTYVSCL